MAKATKSDARKEARFGIVLRGTCRDERRRRSVAEIAELSAHGCKVKSATQLFRQDAPLWIKLGDRDFLEGRVRWHEIDTAGVEWVKPLHPAILDHIYAWHAADETRAVRELPKAQGSSLRPTM